jgi:hypothetical protein
MDPQVRTSFIPKKPVTTAYAETKAPVSIFLLVSLIIFLGSLFAAGGAFAYLAYLKQSIESKSASLDRSRKVFEPAVIGELVRLDNRMKLGKEVLTSHVGASALFSFLEQTTLESVRFTEFGYALDGSGAGTVSMEGEARSFSDVALQSDEFAKQRVLKDIYFDNINTDQAGKVIFSVRASVDPAFLVYANANQQAAEPEQSL